MTFRLKRTYRLCCAHQLHGLGPEHKCARVHGHNYTVDVVIETTALDDKGMVIEAGVLDVHCKRVVMALDHRNLNEWTEGGYPAAVAMAAQPTAENIAAYLWERLGFLNSARPDGDDGTKTGTATPVSLVKVRVREVDDLAVSVRA